MVTSKDFKRKAIKQHQQLREDPSFRARVIRDKKNNPRIKHPKRTLEEDLSSNE